MTETILLCPPTPEGIFTAVYDAYDKRLNPNTTHIQLGEIDNYRLFAEYIKIEADRTKSEKVERSLHKRLGNYVTESLWYAVSSIHPDRGDAVYHTIARGLAGAYRGELLDYLQDPYVALVVKLRIKVWHEVHHYMGFVRFAELKSGILYSEIEPKNDVLPFLGEHFADRFPRENFLIRDKVRKLYLIHQPGKGYFLVHDVNENIQIRTEEIKRIYSQEEEKIRQLFACFVKTVSVESRENKKLQRQMLPIRFRPNMVEFD